MTDSPALDITPEQLAVLVRAELDEAFQMVGHQPGAVVDSIRLQFTVGETTMQVEVTPSTEAASQ